MKFLNNSIRIVDPLLFNALSQLKENKRQIILLFYFCGFNDREIAELNHMSISGVWYQRQVAIKEMRRYLEGKHYE
ncbi:sigma-70 family RNA polymerase sigma factor [Enterococcus casseliflavus]|uniref:RNA polymerase sigma factor n=1 Tax=Enterococcus casseliflavus TaxID=37734 RepID=UPI00115D0B95